MALRELRRWGAMKYMAKAPAFQIKTNTPGEGRRRRRRRRRRAGARRVASDHVSTRS
jgi:hypothetical protein